MKKLLTLIITGALLVQAALLSGCTEPAPVETPDDEISGAQTGTETETYPEAPEAVLTPEDTRIDMNVGGKDISYAELRYYILNLKTQYGGTNQQLWIDESVNLIRENAAMESLAAAKNVTVSGDAKEGYDKSFNEFYATCESLYGQPYSELVASVNCTDSLFRELNDTMFLINYLYDEAYYKNADTLVSEEQLLDYVKENYVRVKHILVKTEGLDDAQKAEARTRADAILSDAKNGASFEALVSEYSEDGMDVDLGYYFTFGEMVSEFETASFALEIGEVSELVESTYGYHIIKRYEMEKDHILADEKINESAAYAITSALFREDVEKEEANIAVTYTEEYEAALAEILAETAAE